MDCRPIRTTRSCLTVSLSYTKWAKLMISLKGLFSHSFHVMLAIRILKQLFDPGCGLL